MLTTFSRTGSSQSSHQSRLARSSSRWKDAAAHWTLIGPRGVLKLADEEMGAQAAAADEARLPTRAVWTRIDGDKQKVRGAPLEMVARRTCKHGPAAGSRRRSARAAPRCRPAHDACGTPRPWSMQVMLRGISAASSGDAASAISRAAVLGTCSAGQRAVAQRCPACLLQLATPAQPHTAHKTLEGVRGTTEALLERWMLCAIVTRRRGDMWRAGGGHFAVATAPPVARRSSPAAVQGPAAPSRRAIGNPLHLHWGAKLAFCHPAPRSSPRLLPRPALTRASSHLAPRPAAAPRPLLSTLQLGAWGAPPPLPPRTMERGRKHHNLRHVLPPAEQAAALAKVGGGPAATLADAGERILSGEPAASAGAGGGSGAMAEGVAHAGGSLRVPRRANGSFRRVSQLVLWADCMFDSIRPFHVHSASHMTTARPSLCPAAKQKELQQLFEMVYGCPTSSFNNEVRRGGSFECCCAAAIVPWERPLSAQQHSCNGRTGPKQGWVPLAGRALAGRALHRQLAAPNLDIIPPSPLPIPLLPPCRSGCAASC